MRYYCQTIPGLEHVTADEIASSLIGASAIERASGVVFVEFENL